MIDHLKEYSLTRATQQSMLALWKEDPNKGTRKIQKMMLDYEDLKTKQLIRDLTLLEVKAQLYLPDELMKEIDKYSTLIYDLAMLCDRKSSKELPEEEIINNVNRKRELEAEVHKTFPRIVKKLKNSL